MCSSDRNGLERIERLPRRDWRGFRCRPCASRGGRNSNGPVKAAARLARDRARVVDIGKLRLDLPWNAYYEKELEVRFSRSYGPGRVRRRYETRWNRLPARYVRWTERQQSCLLPRPSRPGFARCRSTRVTRVPVGERRGRLRPARLRLLGRGGPPLRIPPSRQRPAQDKRLDPSPTIPARRTGMSRALGTGRLRLGFIGAGNYASSVLLPTSAEIENVELCHVATSRSLSALNAQGRFGFSSVSTDSQGYLPTSQLDAVFMVTRHHSHAD